MITFAATSTSAGTVNVVDHEQSNLIFSLSLKTPPNSTFHRKQSWLVRGVKSKEHRRFANEPNFYLLLASTGGVKSNPSGIWIAEVVIPLILVTYTAQNHVTIYSYHNWLLLQTMEPVSFLKTNTNSGRRRYCHRVS